jgi:hypothetical protein
MKFSYLLTYIILLLLSQKTKLIDYTQYIGLQWVGMKKVLSMDYFKGFMVGSSDVVIS